MTGSGTVKRRDPQTFRSVNHQLETTNIESCWEEEPHWTGPELGASVSQHARDIEVIPDYANNRARNIELHGERVIDALDPVTGTLLPGMGYD